MSKKAGDGDKRKVTTDALETLGTIITAKEKRDAIHLAVENVVAQEELEPGEHVGADGTRKNPVGIVDPFLTKPVRPGQRFWLVIYPRQIHSLRHVWTHPAFPDPAELDEIKDRTLDEWARVDKSEAWLRDFCNTHACPPYEEVVDTAVKALAHGGKLDHWAGEYLHFNGSDARGDIPDEFWDHMEVVTGKRFPVRPTGFSCSC